MADLEHPDVSSAQRSGYATFQSGENQDSQENWNEYLEEYQSEIIMWMKDSYPDVLREFAEEYAPRYHKTPTYKDWLN